MNAILVYKYVPTEMKKVLKFLIRSQLCQFGLLASSYLFFIKAQ